MTAGLAKADAQRIFGLKGTNFVLAQKLIRKCRVAKVQELIDLVGTAHKTATFDLQDSSLILVQGFKSSMVMFKRSEQMGYLQPLNA
jgi:hypothetical protein